MKIIFLNAWFGEAGKPFFDFIKEESSKTDVYCFSEIKPQLHLKLEEILKNFNASYQEVFKIVYLGGVTEGESLFVKKGIEIGENGKKYIYRVTKNDAGALQYAKLKIGLKTLWVGNVHGKALPGSKFDTPARLMQSKKIIDLFGDKMIPRIIGGDFNLYPNTKSIKMFEEAGYRNLIKDFNIKNTRNRFAWEQAEKHLNGSGDYFGKQYFADYCFVSPEVKVKNFEVPYLEVSDHFPLILDFEV